MALKEGVHSFHETMGNGSLYQQEGPVFMDKNLMQSYYPKTAAMVQALVEDACDRLDYEGSFIYDEYPDRQEIERHCREICRQMQEDREVQTMERRRGSRDFALLGELAGALLCQEIHCRRCRRNRCRRFF